MGGAFGAYKAEAKTVYDRAWGDAGAMDWPRLDLLAKDVVLRVSIVLVLQRCRFLVLYSQWLSAKLEPLAVFPLSVGYHST